MSREQTGPRWGIFVGGAVLALVLMVGMWALYAVFSGGEESPENTASPTSPSSSSSAVDETPAYDSACGLTGGETELPGNGPGVEWAHDGAWSLPVSREHGPGDRTDGGPWTCFSRTPSGAIIAAYTIAMRAEGVAQDWENVVESQTVENEGRTARLALGPTAADNGVVTPRGYKLEHYSKEAATVRYYLQDAGGNAVSCSIDVRWEEQDWKVVLQEDGATVWGCTQGPPSSYTRWGPA